MHIHKPGRLRHVKESRLLPFLVLLVLIGLASPLQAQTVKRDVVEQRLFQKYGERPVGRGLSAKGHMVEVFATADGNQSFTIVITLPSGASRIVVAGVAWDNFAIRPRDADL